MSFTNCKITLSSKSRDKVPPVTFFQDIEDKHIIDIGGAEAMGRIVGGNYIESQLMDYLELAYDTSKYRYLTVAVPDPRDNGKEFYAEMFRTIGVNQ